MVARGLKGEAKLNTVNGTVEAIFDQLDPTKTLSLASVNGNVVVVIPSDSSVILRAETIHGAFVTILDWLFMTANTWATRCMGNWAPAVRESS